MALKQLFTIGHSLHDVARLVRLLRAAGADAIADVRSQPYSKRLPQFNREQLDGALRESRIAYSFLGEELGGRPTDLELYDGDGHVDYQRMRQTALFRQGIERLLKARQRYTVALLCSEEDPLHCHRGLMIAPAL